MWQTMETAPKGRLVEVKSGKGFRVANIADSVHTWRKDGHVTISYYIPNEDRWVGYTKDAGPDMWHPFPEPPTRESAE
jgi:hypothetical protein